MRRQIGRFIAGSEGGAARNVEFKRSVLVVFKMYKTTSEK
jgi:hypothetical protein